MEIIGVLIIWFVLVFLPTEILLRKYKLKSIPYATVPAVHLAIIFLLDPYFKTVHFSGHFIISAFFIIITLMAVALSHVILSLTRISEE
ncbi:MAG: hypothetical protein HOM01_02430 [Kordiimonadaceae bacterium]|jgi:hypothetical protein|nr:hypothetical protein [Kordiimonadaceae bacterium]